MNTSDSPALLVDGSRPCSIDDLYDRFRALKIEHNTVKHEPMFTVTQSKKLRATDPHGGYTKNLFLRNKKGIMWLITCSEDRQVDLRALAAALGAVGSNGRFSFASHERLARYLGVTPGAVSPLALINDTGQAVQFAIDVVLLDHSVVHLHPLDNCHTTTISVNGLLQFVEHTGHQPVQLKFDRQGVAHRVDTPEWPA